MIWIISLGLIGLGLIFSQFWIVIAGFAFLVFGFFLKRGKPVSRPKAPSGGRVRHKLIQAPQEAWEDEDITTYLQAMRGPPISPDVDFLGSLVDEMKGVDPLSVGIARQVLPFSNYGEASIMQRLFAGLVVPIDKVLYPKTYEMKFKGVDGYLKERGYPDNFINYLGKRGLLDTWRPPVFEVGAEKEIDAWDDMVRKEWKKWKSRH